MRRRWWRAKSQRQLSPGRCCIRPCRGLLAGEVDVDKIDTLHTCTLHLPVQGLLLVAGDMGEELIPEQGRVTASVFDVFDVDGEGDGGKLALDELVADLAARRRGTLQGK